MDVAVIGLGAMGQGLARSLLKAGHKVRVWNRSPGPAESLMREGARRAKDPAEAFQADAVVTMLANDQAVRAVILDEALSHPPGHHVVHVMASTISVGLCRTLEEVHRDAGVDFIAAPVLGRPDVAAAGELNILVAGDEKAVRRVQPLLDAIGKKTWRVGDQPHQASVTKLAANFMLASAMEALAEAFALVRRHDLDAHILNEVLTNTLFAAPAYKVYGPLIADQRFEPVGFKLTLGLKDVRLALEAGEAAGAPLPFASILRDNFIDAIAHGDGDKDWSAVAKVAARRAGLA
jgi:3-hydroxyisobutyrate dehydrogenase-like beta-hydroxyacid dehydrogenase